MKISSVVIKIFRPLHYYRFIHECYIPTLSNHRYLKKEIGTCFLISARLNVQGCMNVIPDKFLSSLSLGHTPLKSTAKEISPIKLMLTKYRSTAKWILLDL